jgi:hypothetical protein
MLRQIVSALFSAILLLMDACDPGMTIRQNKSLSRAGGAAMPAVAIHVKTSHPLIGQTCYAPEVKVTNPSDSPITITSVELVTRRETYANKTARPGTYPLVIQPGSTEIIDVGFRLNDDVKKTFFNSQPSCGCATELATRRRLLTPPLSVDGWTLVRPDCSGTRVASSRPKPENDYRHKADWRCG